MQGVPPVPAIVELTMPFTSVCDGFHLPASPLTEAPAPEEKHTPSFVYAIKAVAHIYMCCVSICANADLLDGEGDLLDWEGKVSACCCWLQLDRADQLKCCC